MGGEMKFRIIAYDYGDPDLETYQVVDETGRGYCENAAGHIEETPYWHLAVEQYEELTGETTDDPDEIIVIKQEEK